MRKTICCPWLWALGLAICALLATIANAQLLDDIEVRSDQGVSEIRLHFTAPVRYIKHFPAERGELIKLYLQVLSLDGTEEMPLQEYKRTPSIPLVPSYTVMYSTARTCLAVRDPLCLDIQFSKPVRFRIRQGEDGRSILLHVLAETDPRPAPSTKPSGR